MKDIGKILKNARENKEYTQKQVMELTGIPENLCAVMRITLPSRISPLSQPLPICMASLQMKLWKLVNRILLFLCFVLNSKFFLYLKNSMQSIRKNF